MRQALEVQTLVRSGNPSGWILLESQAFDLVVLGIHPHNPVERLFLESTTERVLRDAQCSVLTVRSERAEPQELKAS
jgi:nucleotide-binding universal stress UspA family protein